MLSEAFDNAHVRLKEGHFRVRRRCWGSEQQEIMADANRSHKVKNCKRSLGNVFKGVARRRGT